MNYYGTRLSDNISVREPEGYLFCLNVPVARTGYQDYWPEELGLGTGPELIKVYRPGRWYQLRRHQWRLSGWHPVATRVVITGSRAGARHNQGKRWKQMLICKALPASAMINYV